MDYSQFIFALAVIIIGVVRWFIENRANAGNREQHDDTDSDLPEWQWPGEEKQQTPPPLPSSPPPPPSQRSSAPTQAPRQSVKPHTQPPSGLGSLSALQQKIAEAKKRGQQAEAQRIKFASKSPPKQIKPATHSTRGMNWLLEPESLRRAIIAREILGPPLALRDQPDSEIR